MTVGPYLTESALVTLYQKACMSQAAVGQPIARGRESWQTSSSLTMMLADCYAVGDVPFMRLFWPVP